MAMFECRIVELYKTCKKPSTFTARYVGNSVSLLIRTYYDKRSCVVRYLEMRLSKKGLTKIHKFEFAGLGKAPFKVTSVDLYGRLDGCAYCGRAIKVHCWIKSADNKVFKVGTGCVKKTGDKGLVDVVNRMKREHQIKREDERIKKSRENLAAVASLLSNSPHPDKYYADQGNTLLNYVEFLFKNACHSGRLKAARIIDKHYKKL